MIFKIKSEKDEFVKKVYDKSMKELSKFYDLNWKYNKPVIIFVNNREEIDSLYGMKTERWLVAWNDKNKIFLLNPKNYNKESDHTYNEKEYQARIKHELSHAFFGMKTRRASYKPTWFNEGLAIFVSGQNKFKKTVLKFEEFLEFYERVSIGDKSAYKESGFVIELLIKKFGKEKLMKLIEGLDNIKNKEDFEKLFKKIYGFEISYNNLNKLLKN
jgi:hypothetical protein